MSKAYDDWEYENVCPWCGKLYKEVDHYLGCPEPDPSYKPERQKRLIEFVDRLTNKRFDDLHKNET